MFKIILKVNGSVRHKNSENYLRCLELRKRGLSYSEIRKEVPVAKSTLHGWLRASGLTLGADHQLIQARKRVENWRTGVEAAKVTRSQRAKATISEFLSKNQGQLWDPLFLAGAVLYQAEGSKSGNCMFSNSDYRLVQLFVAFISHKIINNPAISLNFRLYLHQSRRSELNRILIFWSEKLRIKPQAISVSWKKNIIKKRRTNSDYVGQMSVTVIGGKLVAKKILAASDIIIKSLGDRLMVGLWVLAPTI